MVFRSHQERRGGDVLWSLGWSLFLVVDIILASYIIEPSMISYTLNPMIEPSIASAPSKIRGGDRTGAGG